MIIYFIKSTLCLALLLVFYHVFLEREKMHQFNRFYLLGSILFSFLVPLYIIYVNTSTPIITENIHLTTPRTVSNGEIQLDIIATTFNYTKYVLILYSIVAGGLLLRFVKNLIAILSKIKRSEKVQHQNATLVLVTDKILPHTFWNAIFINKEAYQSKKIEKELFTHELTHVTQRHTIDVLLIEVLRIIFWYNPIFYFLKKLIQLNHEFLADNEVIASHKNIFEYQHLLLNKATWNNEYYLASNLNYALTKKRLLMMTTKSSRRKMLFKKLAILPIMIGFVFLFAERLEAKENKKDIKVKTKIINPTIENNVLFKKARNKKTPILNEKDTIIPTYTLKIPPPPPRKIKTGFTKLNGETLFYVKQGKKTKYYNKFGQLTDKKAKILSTKRVRGSDVIPNQYLTAIYKDNDVFCEFEKNEDVNYAIPPPPLSPTALIKKMNKENGFKDINNERGYYTTTTKNKNEIAYFYNNKAITKKELDAINPKDIKTVNIKKGKNGSSKIYIIGKE